MYSHDNGFKKTVLRFSASEYLKEEEIHPAFFRLINSIDFRVEAAELYKHVFNTYIGVCFIETCKNISICESKNRQRRHG